MLTKWVRARAGELTDGLPVRVTRVATTENGAPPAGELHVVFRDDSGSRSLALQDVSIGMTVLGMSRRDLLPVKQVASRLLDLLETMPEDLTVPVAHVSDVRGPWTVHDENDAARVYSTFDLTLTVEQQVS